MKFTCLTLFPEMIMSGLNTSITGKAAENGYISLNAVNIRDYTLDRHGKVDDYTYGGGAGMLMQAQPVFDAHRAVAQGRRVRTVYVTPQGKPFTQQDAYELSKEPELIFLCGHYEGIDERVLEEVVTDYYSIGDYVLTGGELPAMVMIDAISRLVPGVLGNDVSAETETFHNDLLEYPQYSRPEIWHEKKVPSVLLSGNHTEIEKWRLEKSKERTEKRRPDLYEKYQEKQRLIKQLSKDKRNNIPMIELLNAGQGEIICWDGENVLLLDKITGLCMMLAADEAALEQLMKKVPKHEEWIFTVQSFVKDTLKAQGFEVWGSGGCSQYLYTEKAFLPVKYKDIRPVAVDDVEDLEYISAHYRHEDKEYIAGRIRAGEMYGAYAENKIIGFIGIHREGSMGMLYVDEAFRRRGIAGALESYCINRFIEKGRIPYCHVEENNTASEMLQERLGLYKAKNKAWWIKMLAF
jgi:tRNA (guanine37-N1)-methyltransferase